MIGLGSNRLSVCRLGGMSVTQAGRGGMEWLAGGRVPDWITPYSAQATAALKAQFPTQWQTIRDYGFAHPALVPFINEDPMLVMSLIEGLGTRYLVSTGNCFIEANWYLNGKYKCVAEIKTPNAIPTGTVFGCGTSFSEARCVTFGKSGQYNAWLWNAGGTAYNDGNIAIVTNTEIVVDIDWNGLTYNGTKYGSGQQAVATSPLYIFARNPTNIISGLLYKRHRNYNNGVLEQEFVPFVSTTRNGMLDIHDLEHPVFYPNAGTGTFTTSESPS